MKQPMTLKEIEVWDKVAIAYMSDTENFMAKGAYEQATIAITVRRAALIEDAHVGKAIILPNWTCRCAEKKEHYQGDEYCEACHTRRPGEVQVQRESENSTSSTITYKVEQAAISCVRCKYRLSIGDQPPCSECASACSKWEADT